MKTKTGNLSRYRGRQFSYTLAVVIFTAVFLWSWENNPLVTSMLSAQEQFMVDTSDFLVDGAAESSIFTNPIKHNSKEFVPLQEAERKEEHMVESAIIFTPDVTVIPTNEENDEISSSSLGTKVCDYTRGRWIADRRRPLYSGLGCKQWLSDMWACRLTQRTDFSYEGYRWQPKNCDLPDFKGSEFLNKMWNKTIAFIGDSLGRQQFQSLMCMVTVGEDRPEVEDIGWKYGLLKHPGAIRPDGWAFRFPDTNTTILYYWSATLTGVEPINAADPATGYAMNLDRPPSFLEKFVSQFDVVVLNTGHHWNRGKVNANKWVMHVNMKPVVDRKLAQIGNAKNFTVYCITRWLDSQMLLYPGLKAFFRTISPRHFFYGEWNTGGSCNNTTPLTRGSEVQQDESSDPVISEAVKGTKVKLLDITSISELRDEGHISHYTIKASSGINDCLHWCLPGIPDTWNELLCAQL